MSTGPRVLVVRFSSLGDVVLVTPLLRAIARRHPAAQVTVVTKLAYAELLETNPHVARVIPLAPGERLPDLAAALRAQAFDARLDLQGSPRSRQLRRLVGGRWTAHAKGRAARLAQVWLGRRPRAPVPSVAERYFGAARALDVTPDADPADVFPAPEDEARAAAVAPPGFVALAPGASRATKRWPPSHWRTLAGLLGRDGVPVVAVGAAAERSLLCGDALIEAYGLPLRAVAALLHRARAVVTNDSGLMHLATAARRPVVALFGPTSPELGFFPYRAAATVVERSLACRPCSVYGSDHCPLGHHRCMIDIAPEDVARAVLEVA